MLVIYSKDGCSACDSAKMMLTNIGVDFSVVNTSEDFDAFEFILSEGHRSFPQIYNYGKLFVQGGYQGLVKMGTEEIRRVLIGSESIAA